MTNYMSRGEIELVLLGARGANALLAYSLPRRHPATVISNIYAPNMPLTVFP